MPADPRRVKELFAAAVDLADPPARQQLLDRECADDAELRRRLDALLAAHDRPDVAVDRPFAVPPTADFTEATDLVGTVVAGRYKLLEEIGEGGMGTVWMAEQREPVKRLVALKLIKPGMDSKAVLARFEAERQALALMDHPNIAKVLDGGTVRSEPEALATGNAATVANASGSVGRPYFVMELVKGLPLTEYCDARRLSVRDRLGLFVQICQAVQHAHQKGIIHRDLKPSNILVTEHDGRPVPKVIDFGLAKALHTPHALTERTLYTSFGTMVGTPLYMAPEQVGINALDVDTRTDIYALGVVLYELLTGTTPLEKKRFREAAWDEMRRLIREEEPPKPSVRLSSSQALPSLAAQRQTEPAKLSRLVRGELDWIVLKALEKDRNRRYDTANGLAMDVQRHLADEPVLAGPPGAGYRLRKFVRRHRGRVAAAGLVLLALVGGVIGTTSGLILADRARQAEADQRAVAEAKEKQATEAAEEARAVLGFFQDRVLAAGRPEGLDGGLGKDVTLRQALDAARPEVGRAFRDRPLVEASIRRVMADTYWYLGERAGAVPEFERVLDLRTAHLPPDHPDLLTSLNDLAVVYHESGQPGRALPLYEQALAGRRARFGPNAPATFQSLHGLCKALDEIGDRGRAIALLEQDIAARRAAGRMDQLESLKGLACLGQVLCAGGKPDQGIPLLEEALDRNRRNWPDHIETFSAAAVLAKEYRDSGRSERAAPLYEQAVAGLTRKFGPTHPETLKPLAELGGLHLEAGRPAAAVRLLEPVLPEDPGRLGPDQILTLDALYVLAAAYHWVGQPARAVTLFERLLPVVRRRLGADHGLTARCQNNLALAYHAVGAADMALPLFEQSLPVITATDGPDAFRTLVVAGNLGRCLTAVGRPADAERVLRDCLDRCTHTLPDHYLTSLTASLLGGAVAAQGRYAEAEPLLIRGYEGMKARLGTVPLWTPFYPPEAADRLAQFYEAWGKPDEAAKWRAERAKYPAAPPPAVK